MIYPQGYVYDRLESFPDPPEVPVCSPATCYSCGKTTWAGCGMHVDAVFARVPVEARCTCHDDAQEPSTGSNAFGW